jgi:hypothetical protein
MPFKSDLSKLTESHDQLQAKILILTPGAPIAINVDPYPTTPCCEHASLIEENSKLKAQLKKKA